MLFAAAGCHQTDTARAAAAVDAARPPVTVHYAGRCGECHEKMFAEWRDSAHARSGRAPLYLAMRAHADGRSCDRCHTPLTPLVDPNNPVASEGVTCEVCHTIAGVEVERGGGGYRLDLESNIKYGPLCDAKNHYFHKMGCSPLHEQSRLCAGCHLWYRGDVPVFTEYEEWSKSAAAAEGLECQGCHMPGDTAAVAVGAGVRGHVPGHGFLGRDGRLRGRGLALELAATRERGQLVVTARLTAKGVGHRVPTGLPEHRLVLRVRVLDQRGRELATDERVYGRVLVDERGAPAPFYAATRVASDSRLTPDEPRVESFRFAGAGAVELRAEVYWRAIPRELAAAIGALAPPDERLAQARAALR